MRHPNPPDWPRATHRRKRAGTFEQLVLLAELGTGDKRDFWTENLISFVGVQKASV